MFGLETEEYKGHWDQTSVVLTENMLNVFCKHTLSRDKVLWPHQWKTVVESKFINFLWIPKWTLLKSRLHPFMNTDYHKCSEYLRFDLTSDQRSDQLFFPILSLLKLSTCPQIYFLIHIHPCPQTPHTLPHIPSSFNQHPPTFNN